MTENRCRHWLCSSLLYLGAVVSVVTASNIASAVQQAVDIQKLDNVEKPSLRVESQRF